VLSLLCVGVKCPKRKPRQSRGRGHPEARTRPRRRGTDDPPGTHPTAKTVDPGLRSPYEAATLLAEKHTTRTSELTLLVVLEAPRPEATASFAALHLRRLQVKPRCRDQISGPTRRPNWTGLGAVRWAALPPRHDPRPSGPRKPRAPGMPAVTLQIRPKGLARRTPPRGREHKSPTNRPAKPWGGPLPGPPRRIYTDCVQGLF
jgi:hypothetical protein